MNQILVVNFSEEFTKLVSLQAGDPEFAELGAKLGSRKVILAPFSIYATKLVGGRTSEKIIDPSANDKREIGLRNFDQAKLNKDVFLMVTSVQLRAATVAGLTEAQLKSIKYDSIADSGAAPNDGILQNGEVNFRFGNLQLLRDYPTSNFATEGNGNVQIGEVVIPLRRIIKPQTDFEFEVKAPAGVAFPADYALRVDIKGIATIINS